MITIRGITFEENLKNRMGLEFYDLSHPWGLGQPCWPYFEDVKIERLHSMAKSGVLTQRMTPGTIGSPRLGSNGESHGASRGPKNRSRESDAIGSGYGFRSVAGLYRMRHLAERSVGRRRGRFGQ